VSTDATSSVAKGRDELEADVGAGEAGRGLRHGAVAGEVGRRCDGNRPLVEKVAIDVKE